MFLIPPTFVFCAYITVRVESINKKNVQKKKKMSKESSVVERHSIGMEGRNQITDLIKFVLQTLQRGTGK